MDTGIISSIWFSFLFQFIRCCQIMGRNEQDELTAAQIFYPCMQCADIFFLKVTCFTRDVMEIALCRIGFQIYLDFYC